MAESIRNILLLHTDQQRFDAIAAMGGGHVHTPNMDRLVRRGLSFRRAYSSSPFCIPARHDLITGVSARHHGYWMNMARPIADYRLPTIPRLLSARGYQTMAVGKMHFQPECEHHGFNHMYLMEEITGSWENDAYLRFLRESGHGAVRCQHGVRPIFYPVPQHARVPEECHGSAWVAHQTNELLRTSREEPFFIFSSWVGPHPPFYVPQDYLERYSWHDLPPSRLPHDDPLTGKTVPPEFDVNHRWVHRFKEGYFAAVTLIDRWLGTVLDTLEETGLDKNTLIIFTADHGELLGDRRMFSKTVPYEGSAHIPLILSGPGVPEGEIAETAVNTWDTAATILAAAGITDTGGPPIIGQNLLEMERNDPDRIVINHQFEGARRWIAAINGRYKFIHNYAGSVEELYDLAEDPWEQENRIGQPELADITTQLRRACLAFEAEHGPVGAVEDGAFVPRPPKPPRPEDPSEWPVPWPFNWQQYPRWMNGYSEADYAAILREMRDVIASEGNVFVPRDEDWRDKVYAGWQRIGGNRRDLAAVLAEADASYEA